MSRRRFVNLVSRYWGTKDIDSLPLCRIDAAKHLFYRSVEKAAAVAAADNEKVKKKEYTRTLQLLPDPIMSFKTGGVVSPGLDWFELFAPRRGEGRIVHSNSAGETGMFDLGTPLVLTLPGLAQAKGLDPVSLSVSHPSDDGGDDSLYVLDRFPGQTVTQAATGKHPGSCFEVLEYRSLLDRVHDKDKRWQWRPLPPPPFVYHQPSSYISSYTTNKGAADGCTTVCVSSSDPHKNNGGTYFFDTARHEETWRHVGDWELPFEGRSEHVPELGVWLGFTAGQKPHHLCAVADLSAAMEGPCREPPTLQHVWEDATLPGEEDWEPRLLKVISMGGNRFCVAKIFVDKQRGTGDQFAVLTGVEIQRDGPALRMVRHKRTRYVFVGHTVKWVLRSSMHRS